MSHKRSAALTYQQRRQQSSDELMFLLDPQTPEELRYAGWLCGNWGVEVTDVIGRMVARAIERGTAELDDRAARGR